MEASGSDVRSRLETTNASETCKRCLWQSARAPAAIYPIVAVGYVMTSIAMTPTWSHGLGATQALPKGMLCAGLLAGPSGETPKQKSALTSIHCKSPAGPPLHGLVRGT
ncbi:hypothetical protein BX600DRAFT_403834 [Xylariales sp. PMI_506]|nr:hypothetical protein BX600DRAFT_403834 [Xylariales sp. PMI_506]